MSLIIPISGSGEVALETRELLTVCRGSLTVRFEPERVLSALGSAELTGERFNSGYAVLLITGLLFRAVRSSFSVRAGERPDDPAYGALDSGSVEDAPALGSSETTGVITGRSFGSVETSGAENFVAYAVLSAVPLPALAAVFGSAGVAGQTASPALGSAAARRELQTASRSILETAQDTQAGVMGSIETGSVQSGQAYGSLETASGSGVDFMIEIIDTILSGAHGDC